MSQYTESGRTENFFTRHVKLITFLVTVGVFLAVFGPILFFEMNGYYKEKDERPQITAEQVMALAEQGFVKKSQLKKFAGTEGESSAFEGYVDIYLDVAGGRYYLTALASANSDQVFDCYLYDLKEENGKGHDLFKSDVEAILGRS